MSIIYHDQLNFKPLRNWVKNESFNPSQDSIEGIRYHISSKYEEQYGVVQRISRVVLALLLSIILVPLACKSSREFIWNAFFDSVKYIHLIRTPEAHQSQLEEIAKIPCPIAKETALACFRGSYTNSSEKKYALNSGNQLLKRSQEFPNALIKNPVSARFESCEIEVVNQDCLDAAQLELNARARKVAVLMLASPIEPGGAMEEGNQGQEEDICRRSDIFGFMWDQSHFLAEKILYNLVDVTGPHQKNPKYLSMTNNKMLHIPRVTVFRSKKDEGYKMLDQPFQAGMLVSPGLDRPEYVKVKGKTEFVRSEDQEQLDKLITTQLKVAYDGGYDSVILGAFGCGAFFNPPELIAESYKRIIDHFFDRAFKKITFAIIDDRSQGQHNPIGNFKPFHDCFMQL